MLEDLLSGGPAGRLDGCLSSSTYALVDRQRDAFAGLSGFGAILGFAAAAMLACGMRLHVVALYYWRIYRRFAPVMGELAMTVVFYVPVALVLGRLHRRLVGPLRSDF